MTTLNIDKLGWVISDPPLPGPMVRNRQTMRVKMHAKCRCGVRFGYVTARDIDAGREAQQRLVPLLRTHHKTGHGRQPACGGAWKAK